MRYSPSAAPSWPPRGGCCWPTWHRVCRPAAAPSRGGPCSTAGRCCPDAPWPCWSRCTARRSSPSGRPATWPTGPAVWRGRWPCRPPACSPRPRSPSPSSVRQFRVQCGRWASCSPVLPRRHSPAGSRPPARPAPPLPRPSAGWSRRCSPLARASRHGCSPVSHAGRVNMAVAVVSAALLLAQADLLAAVLTAGVAHRAPPAALAVPLAMLAGVAAARAALGWGRDVLAQRRASRAKAVLRQRLLACAMRRGPVWRGGQRAGELVTLAGRGLDGLDGYVAGYLPQLALTAVVPSAVLVRLALADWPSAVIIALTVPLRPLFAVLAGRQPRTAATRQYQVLVWLGGHFLDVITGLPTLLAFNRETPQIGEVGRIAHAHRRTT